MVHHQPLQRATRVATTPLDPSEVTRVAYALYEQRGRTHGHDQDDWFQAEQLVRRCREGRA